MCFILLPPHGGDDDEDDDDDDDDDCDGDEIMLLMMIIMMAAGSTADGDAHVRQSCSEIFDNWQFCKLGSYTKLSIACLDNMYR